MQSQINTYAFQLREQCVATSLASHPKQLIYYAAAYHQSADLSYLYTLKYNEENPRKSLLCTQKLSGKIHKIFNFVSQGFIKAEDTQNQQNASTLISVSESDNCRLLLGSCNRQLEAGNNQSEASELNGFSQIYKSSDIIKNCIYRSSNKSVYWNTNSSIIEYSGKEQAQAVRQIGGQGDLSIKNIKIDPIHDYITYVTTDNQIHILDKSLKNIKYEFRLNKNSSEPVLNIDYNPNKQYYLMSTHPSCIKFWDIRKPILPIKLLLGEQTKHSLLLTSQYNYSHDQLVVSGFDDGTVGLYRMTSVSSVPNKDQQDVLVKLYDQHEDSVYCLQWSEYSPWVFASIAYGGGNIVINLVPNVEKYRILL